MRQIKLWSIALITCFIPVGAIAIPPTQLDSTILAQAERSLTGSWVFRFEGDGRPPSTMVITQSGDRFTIDGEYGEIVQMKGTISGNRISIERIILSPNNPDNTGDAIYGTVSADGNVINGELILKNSADKTPVVMQRVSENAPGQGIQSPPSINPPPNINSSEMFW